MTELEKLQRAKMYIEKLANGINPLDDTTISENDIVNNVRLSRCFFYVSDLLGQVIDNGGSLSKNKEKSFHLLFLLKNFPNSNLVKPVYQLVK